MDFFPNTVFYNFIDTCDFLGIEHEFLESMVMKKEIVYLVTKDGMIIFPSWQFTSNDDKKINNLYIEVFQKIQVKNSFVNLLWFNEKNDVLGESPIDYLASKKSLNNKVMFAISLHNKKSQ